jgi:hypothetical protein
MMSENQTKVSPTNDATSANRCWMIGIALNYIGHNH